jgi:hypothetical protein
VQCREGSAHQGPPIKRECVVRSAPGPSRGGVARREGCAEAVLSPHRAWWQEEKDWGKPDDQLELTEEDKEQDIERMLSAKNPDAPINHARFSYKDRAFKVSDAIQVSPAC